MRPSARSCSPTCSGKVHNVVFLTTDVHANLVNDARFKTLEDGGPVNSGILDVTTGPIATATYALEISDTVGNESAGSLVQSAFFKPQPPNGVGMQCAATDQFSYAQVEVSKSRADGRPARRRTTSRSATPATARPGGAALRAGRDPEAVARCEPRRAFPASAPAPGHYESFYLKATRPGGGRRGSGSATRSTSDPARSAQGSVWFTLFDADAPGPRATKLTVAAGEVSAPAGGLHRGRRRAAGARAGERRARDRRA